MAGKKPKTDNTAYDALRADLSQGSVGRLYVFHGEEVYLRETSLKQMKQALLPPGLEEFNLHTLTPQNYSLDALQTVVDCLPMMSERTMIVVTDCDIYKGDRDGLIALLSDLPDYVCLVFVYDLVPYKPDSRTKLAAAVKKYGQVVNFDPQEPKALLRWIARRFQAQEHEIGPREAQHLIDMCGDLMTGLISEIGKVSAYAKDRRVTLADIDAVVTPKLDAVAYQMTDAVARRDFDRAAAVLAQLYHMQQNAIPILAALGRQLRQVYAARLTLEAGGNASKLSALLSLRWDWQARNPMEAARRFSLPWCRWAVERCGQLDLAMKSTGTDPQELLTGFLLEMAAKEAALC